MRDLITKVPHSWINEIPQDPSAWKLPLIPMTVPSGGDDTPIRGVVGGSVIGRASKIVGWTGGRRVVLATALTMLLTSTGIAQILPAPPTGPEPTFRVEVWGYISEDFSKRVQSYFDLRSKLQEDLPPLRVTEDVSEIRNVRRALARRIQAARHGAQEGDIFSPAISVQFKAALALEMNADAWAVIMDDNPGEFSHEINGIYPDGKPYSTVPGTILAVLPTLPDAVEYRFLGRHLILLDTRANVILDRIPYAIRCVDCDHDASLHKRGDRD